MSRGVARCCMLLIVLFWVSESVAGDVGGAESTVDVDGAQRHLHSGVTFFAERNYEAALVEFEASFERMPSASALQSIGICQTKLFRYVDAVETLEQLRARFGSVLSVEDSMQVDDALRSLARFVGTLTVRVVLSTAAVTVNGRRLLREELCVVG